MEACQSMKTKRFGVSIPENLLDEFDELVSRKEYVGRSEAIRDAMRLFISKNKWDAEDTEGFASLNIVYEHRPQLTAALLEIQHDAEVEVISTLHTHITRTHCFEVITMRGNKRGIRRVADRIGGITGIEFLELFTFSLPEGTPAHHHTH